MKEELDDPFISQCASRFNLNVETVRAKARELEVQAPPGGWRSIRGVLIGACKRLAGWEPAKPPAQPDPSTVAWSKEPCLCYACRWGFKHGATLEEIQAQVKGEAVPERGEQAAPPPPSWYEKDPHDG